MPVQWHLLLDWVCPYLGIRICFIAIRCLVLSAELWTISWPNQLYILSTFLFEQKWYTLTTSSQLTHTLVIFISLFHHLFSVFTASPILFSCHSLFHVVVESDDISTQIIRHLTSEKGGRVTFIPLNRVKVSDTNYPQSPDVVPLLKKLKYRAEYSHAFKQVLFSRD